VNAEMQIAKLEFEPKTNIQELGKLHRDAKIHSH